MSLLRLFAQPLARLFAEVVHVLLGDENLDAMYEPLRRAGLIGDDGAFLDEVDLNTQVVEESVVFQVAIQPVSLLDQHHRAGRGPPQERSRSCSLLLTRAYSTAVRAAGHSISNRALLSHAIPAGS